MCYVMWQLNRMAIFVSQEVDNFFVQYLFGSRIERCLKWLCFIDISCGINEELALKCSLLPPSTLFHGIYYGNIERLMILLTDSAKNPLSTF